MPLPTASGARFDTNYVENTMGAAPVRTSRASLRRLKSRYQNVNLESATRSLCVFLRGNGSRTNNLDKFRVAERAIFPLFGAASKNQGVSSGGEIVPSTLEAAIYFWIAACDDSPAVSAVSSVDDRKQNYLRALYESQRGNNNGERVAGVTLQNSARINFNDDGDASDRQICAVGTLNKLCEFFVGCHPDVELIAELNGRVLYLIKGFLADKCLQLGFTLDQLAEGTVNLELLDAEAIAEVHGKVIAALGGLYQADNNLGLVGAPELRYLEESLSPGVIEYLDFSIERNAGSTTPVTPAEVQTLISDANEQLRRATIILNADPNVPTRVFPYDRACTIIKDLIPSPITTTQHIWENNLGTRAPVRGMQDLNGWNHARFEADYNRYYARREAEREAAMLPQSVTMTGDQCAKVREDRHQARGMRSKT